MATVKGLLKSVGLSAWLLGMVLSQLTGALGSTLPAPTSHYVRPATGKPPFKDRVIVFVHGIFGDAQSTWTSSGGAYWPTLLLDDSAFNDSDVYVANYESPISGNTLSVDEIVAILDNRLADAGVFENHREVVFVCHSLGGIIIQQLLLTVRAHAAQVPFIYFFAVPEEGSQVATLGRWFSSDPLLEALFHGNENTYLLNLENQWRAAHFKIRRYCAYEKKPLKSAVLIVDRLSGTRNCDELPVPISEDHFGIVKPNNREHQSYIALRTAIKANPISSKGGSTKSSALPPSYVYLIPTSGLMECNKRAFFLKMVGTAALYNVDVALVDTKSGMKEVKHYPEIDPGAPNPETPLYLWLSPSSPWDEDYTVTVTSRDPRSRSVERVVLRSIQKQLRFAMEVTADNKKVMSCRDKLLPSSYTLASRSHESCKPIMDLPSDALRKLDPQPYGFQSPDGAYTSGIPKTIPPPSELDVQAEDRHITEYQRALFKEILGKHRKTSLLILYAGAPKTLAYANEFREMFGEWNVLGPQPVPAGNERIIDVQIGVEGNTAVGHPTATAILDFLKRAGIRHGSNLVLDPSIPHDLIVLWLGPKGPSGSDPDDCLPPLLRQRPGQSHTCETVRQATCPWPDRPSDPSRFNIYMRMEPPL